MLCRVSSGRAVRQSRRQAAVLPRITNSGVKVSRRWGWFLFVIRLTTISTAIGVALGHRLNRKDNYVYLILGDGECNEGQIWEGVQFAAHWQVDKLIAFVDANQKQLDGYTKDINDLAGLAGKFACFGWHSQEVDGHDIGQIVAAVERAKQAEGRPSVIVLDTVKGKGCCFAEPVFLNHHMVISPEMAAEAIAELEKDIARCRCENS
jgi:transketolase